MVNNNHTSNENKDLLEASVSKDPISLFGLWSKQVTELGGTDEASAMTVSTIGLDGFPKARVVLLKHFDENGFVFYTNYNSEKGKAIASNSNICLSFFFHSMERQIIIKGIAGKTAKNISDNYFASRPYGSRLSAAVSPQSEVIPSREFLSDKIVKIETELQGKDIPRPEHWGGYLVRPVSIEFWQGRQNRFHDRIRYTLQEDASWKIEQLAP